MTYDFMERLAGIAKTEITYGDDVCFLGHDVAAQIVAAEIIANAIKEAARPAKREPLEVSIKPMANGAAIEDLVARKLREAY